jgi:hypothetical protein
MEAAQVATIAAERDCLKLRVEGLKSELSIRSKISYVFKAIIDRSEGTSVGKNKREATHAKDCWLWADDELVLINIRRKVNSGFEKASSSKTGVGKVDKTNAKAWLLSLARNIGSIPSQKKYIDLVEAAFGNIHAGKSETAFKEKATNVDIGAVESNEEQLYRELGCRLDSILEDLPQAEEEAALRISEANEERPPAS